MEQIKKAQASTEFFLYSVDKNLDSVNQTTKVYGQWERIPMKVDSGAIDTVIPKAMAGFFNTEETEASKRGPGFRAANGTPIRHYGKRAIKGFGDDYQPMKITALVADVKTMLGSVNQIMKDGNIVHFEKGSCYIKNVRTGKKIQIAEKNGTFEVGIWVPKKEVVQGDQQSPFQRPDA